MEIDNNLDKETSQLISSEKKLELLVEHEGWEIVREKFANAVMDMQSILNIADADPQAMVIELKSRAMAISVLRDWMADIEGTAEKSKNFNQVKPKATHILRGDEI